MPPVSNGWKESEMFVLNKLDEHTEAISAVRGDTQRILVELSSLKVKVTMKAALIGALSALVPALALVLLRVV